MYFTFNRVALQRTAEVLLHARLQRSLTIIEQSYLILPLLETDRGQFQRFDAFLGFSVLLLKGVVEEFASIFLIEILVSLAFLMGWIVESAHNISQLTLCCFVLFRS